MLRQSLLATAVSIRNIAIHAMMMVALIQVARIASESATSRQSLRLTAVHERNRIGLDGLASCRSAGLVICLLAQRYFLGLILFILPLQATQRLATAT